MKVKQVYAAPPEEVQALKPAPAAESEPQPLVQMRQPKPSSVGNIERDILQRWQRFTLVFRDGAELDVRLIEFGTYWLHVDTDDGERLINKASIEQIAPLATEAQP